jgi:hypothetical protein
LLLAEKPFGSGGEEFRTASKLPNLPDSRSVVSNAAASGLRPLLHPLAMPLVLVSKLENLCVIFPRHEAHNLECSC